MRTKENRCPRQIVSLLLRAVCPAVFCAVLLAPTPLRAQEDNSVEGLYRKAAEAAVAGQFDESIATYEKLFDLVKDFLCEDFGAQAGGIVFDYGMVLLQKQEWQKARDAFDRCHNFNAKECTKAKIKNKNSREVIALFQWGFCEDQLGNPARALELYDQYLNLAKSDPELPKYRNAFKLRRGSVYLKLGRVDEGVKEIRELFDRRLEWQVTPQFLMQGMLELGLGWVEQARKIPVENPGEFDQIEAQAHLFLDQNAGIIDVSPVDKFRFGFIDRLKKLGFASSEVGLQSLALRFYSMVPTLEDIEYDIQGRIQILPGGAVPAAYQNILNQIDEAKKRPVPSDVEMQRLYARSLEMLGNYHGPREIYRHLADAFPTIEKDRRAEILHEAARFSTMLGDYSSAQYFGELFMAEMPDHKLRENVSVFMLQSLFTSGQFEEVIKICESIRSRFELGDQARELPDALYGLALYSLKRYVEAIAAMDEYAKTYKGTPNREMVVYHRANARMITRDFRGGADLAMEFQQEFPKSEKYFDLSLADMALCRFNIQDYSGAITAVEQLETEYPNSQTLDRAMNIKGDSHIVRSQAAPEVEEIAKSRQLSLDSYLKAIQAGKALEASGKNENFHKMAVGEAISKAVDLYVADGEALIQPGKELPEETKAKFKTAVELYDSFFPNYAGSYYEPQLSVFTIPALESVGRGEDGLIQLEKMINVLGAGDKETGEVDIDLLRKAIGSYSEASKRIRGLDKTLATLGKFPGLNTSNLALGTWLKMQEVIVLQVEQKKTALDSPEFASFEAKIQGKFKEMELFSVKELSEIALKMIADYLVNGPNPFLAVRYCEELLLRSNPQADQFKASSELILGRIESKQADPEKIRTARDRFKRVIDVYKDEALIPEARYEISKLAIATKTWPEAIENLKELNQDKKALKDKRPEITFLYGVALEGGGDVGGAFLAYTATWTTYASMAEWSTQALENWLKLGFKDADTNIKEPVGLRAKKIEFYKTLKRKMAEWQKFPDSPALSRLRLRLPEMRTELGITVEEEIAINRFLGLNEDGTRPDTEKKK